MELKNNSIIICPNEKKEELISKFSSSLLYSVKYVTKEELISSLTFSYDYKTLLYLMKNIEYSFDNAKEILDNIHFLNKGTDKLDKLVEIREKLRDAKLLKINNIYKKLFDGKDVFVYGYSSLDVEIEKILNDNKIHYSYINESVNNYSHKIKLFENIEDEVEHFFLSVCKMKCEGINLNDILLYSYPSEYDLILRKYSRLYRLPINFESNNYLKDSPLFIEFLSLVNEMDYQDALLIIKDKKDRFNVFSKIVSLVNEVLNTGAEKEEQIKLISEVSKKIKIKENNYEEGINIVSSSYRGNKHVFLLGFSLGSYPRIKKDTDFLLDKEKSICGRNTSRIDNEINNEELINFLLCNKNIHISFKKKMGKTVYYKSLLVEKLGMENEEVLYDNIRYSESLAKLEVASYKDLKNDYGIDSEYVDALDESELEYKSFDHNFKPSSLFENDKNMEVSFSLIDDYVHCPFKYFIKRICGADVFEETFYLKLGTLLHNVLEDSLKKEVKKEDYQNQIDENFTSNKDMFFANKLFDQVFEVITKNKEFSQISSFNLPYGEQEIAYRFDDKTVLKGKIDKVILNEKEKEIIIIDYKTGSFVFNKNQVEAGLSLQLPIYSLLISKYYPEYSQTGIYIQTILSDDDNIDEKYKLNGVSINSDGKLERLEHGLTKKSKFIEKLYLGQKGYKENASLISKEEFEKIVSICENKVTEVIENIRKGNYSISPLYLNGKDQTCNKCPLLSVCFKNDTNHRYIKINSSKEE